MFVGKSITSSFRRCGMIANWTTVDPASNFQFPYNYVIKDWQLSVGIQLVELRLRAAKSEVPSFLRLRGAGPRRTTESRVRSLILRYRRAYIQTLPFCYQLYAIHNQDQSQ
jgi:hypothetical protein